MPQSSRLYIPFSAAIATVALSLAGCGGHEEGAQHATPPRLVEAQATPISLAAQPERYAAPASVVAETQVQVASRLMGYIREISVSEGQRVSPGQRLFSIDPVDIQGQVDQARAGLKQAEDALQDAKVEYDRFSALFKEEAVTRQQYEKMKLQHDLAVSRAAQAKAGLATASNQLRYATVTSPITGVVTRKLANAGDLAAPGQPVLVLENPAKLQIQTHVPDSVFRTLKIGTQVLVEVDGRTAPVQAKVAQLSPAADPVSRLFLVKLDTAAEGLHSGLFARAQFPLGERQVLTVPEGALVTRAGISGVFVADADGIVQFRMVQRGAALDGRVEVQAGLTPGERIVTEGAEKLESGDKIRG